MALPNIHNTEVFTVIIKDDVQNLEEVYYYRSETPTRAQRWARDQAFQKKLRHTEHGIHNNWVVDAVFVEANTTLQTLIRDTVLDVKLGPIVLERPVEVPSTESANAETLLAERLANEWRGEVNEPTT